MWLSPKQGVHASSMTTNLELNIVGKTWKTGTDKSNLQLRNSLNLQ